MTSSIEKSPLSVISEGRPARASAADESTDCVTTRKPAKFLGVADEEDSSVMVPLRRTPGAGVRATVISSPRTGIDCIAVRVPGGGPPSARATIVYLPGVTFVMLNVPSGFVVARGFGP